MANEMIERVARALADGEYLGPTLAFTDARPTDAGSVPAIRKHDTERALSAARAAIEATPLERYKAALERIAHGLEGGESFSGSYCSEIAFRALSD